MLKVSDLIPFGGAKVPLGVIIGLLAPPVTKRGPAGWEAEVNCLLASLNDREYAASVKKLKDGLGITAYQARTLYGLIRRRGDEEKEK